MFSFISKDWRGKPLDSLATIVNLIANTTTDTGLHIETSIDYAIYFAVRNAWDSTKVRIATHSDNQLRKRGIVPNAKYRKNHMTVPKGRPPKDKHERRYCRQRWKLDLTRHKAFTLIEMLIALAIVALLAGISGPLYNQYMDKTKTAIAIADIKDIEARIEQLYITNMRLPDTLAEIGGAPLDPWDNPYQYLNIADADNKAKGKLRKDKNLVPINSDYDLYSMGADGSSVSPLTAKASRDDIVRANNGKFVGLASEY